MPNDHTIQWKIKLTSGAGRVYELLTTDAGRASFWCRESRTLEGGFELTFPNGERLACPVHEAAPAKRFVFGYFGGSRVQVGLRTDGPETILTLTESGLDAAGARANRAGWVSLLLMLKARADHGVDLRHGATGCTWDDGFVDQ